ncbi:MAG: hypothetical protein Q8P51_10160 [Ignavibacteria bacterium]|nr:hypothetical protein [Ignavibacteria bacterium]
MWPRIVFVWATATWVMLCSCGDSNIVEERDEQLSYRVAKGACGRVVFDERIGTGYTSAFKTIEERKVEAFEKYCPEAPCHRIRLEPFELEVVDEKGVAPAAKFFGLKVLDRETGSLLHSVSEVITTDGDLFQLQWCLD